MRHMRMRSKCTSCKCAWPIQAASPMGIEFDISFLAFLMSREAASMEQELEVLNEAHAGLVKADSVNPDAVGPIEGVGACLFGLLVPCTCIVCFAAHSRQQHDQHVL